MNKIPRIALVIPYFGKWPNYFDIYLKGCENNTWLDILFFTDCEEPPSYPLNVTFIRSSLPAISDLLLAKTNISVDIKFAYKLCDLRPLYGKIFEDYLKDYDYWAYGDIDLIYGKLGDFVLPRISTGFDVLSSRRELLSGSLSFFRNTDVINNYYLNSVTDVSALKSDTYNGIDETGHCHITWAGGSKSDLPKYAFTYIINEAQEKGILKVSFETICSEIVNTDELVKFQKGELDLNGVSLGYFHYVCNKSQPFFYFPNWLEVPESFIIAPTGFYNTIELKSFAIRHIIRYAKGKAKNIINKISRKLR